MRFLLIPLLFPLAFYLPGVAYHEYTLNQSISIYSNGLFSSHTQLPFPASYLPFCPASSSPSPTNLGQVLAGDRVEVSPYTVHMQREEMCALLCTANNTETEMDRFRWMIEKEYKASWTVDGLPAGLRQTVQDAGKGSKYSLYTDGFPLGYHASGLYFLYNHLHIVLQVHQTNNYTDTDTPDAWIIVGALVNPMSLNPLSKVLPGCQQPTFLSFLSDSRKFPESPHEEEIPEGKLTHPAYQLSSETVYSYSVVFEPSNVKWASRWDLYMHSGKDLEVHWLSIINSFAMVIFLSALVAHILGRSLKRDIYTYNEQRDVDALDESGWKQLGGDVFRPPTYPGLFCIVIGSGLQLLCMANVTLALSCLGFLMPEHRGWLLTTVLFGFALMGTVAGFCGTKLYITLGGQHRKKNAIGLALFYPGLAFTVFFLINLCLWAEHSSGAVPFPYLLYILLIWLGLSAPLVLLGCRLVHIPFTFPCKSARIPKPLVIIPGQFKLRAISILAGSLPFGCMFIELNYVMQSLWHHSLFYYLFGFLLLCFLVLIVTSAEVSILLTYLLLCKEDPRWWWWSFGVSANSGLYFFLYSCVYFFTELGVTRLSGIVLYFGYMLLCSVTYALVTGCVGFWATFFFIRAIYSLIRVD